MKKLFLILGIFTAMAAAADQEPDDKSLIYRLELSLYHSELEKELLPLKDISPTHQDREKVLRKAFLLFRRGILSAETAYCEEAYDFISKMYDRAEYKEPVILAYKGAIRAAIAGSLTDPNPIPKLELLGEGEKMLNRALEEQLELDKKNHLALGYIYFLRGRTFSSVPVFLPAFKTAPKNLKQSLSRYKKVKNLHPTLIANVFYSYGLYYLNLGKISLALKNMKKARNYADAYFLEEIDAKIQELEE